MKTKKKDICTDSQDFIKLCLLVHERNEIYRRRQSIRNQLYVYKKAGRDLEANNRIKRLRSQLNGLAKSGEKFDSALDTLAKVAKMHINKYDMADKNEQRIRQERERLQGELAKLGEPKHITKKFKGMSSSELALKVAYLERDMAQVTIDQYEFTARTRSDLADLTKKYNVKVKRASYYNRIDGVTINGQYVSAKELEDRAVTEIMERELL
jgi:hypothetical protein